MDISNIDPIQEGVSLTRFMHVRRSDYPDIDIDFPYDKRDGIYASIFKRWPGRVARISNHVTYGEKSALRESLRRQGVKGMLPRDLDPRDYLDETEAQEAIEEAHALEGGFRCHSLHCGGIVIFRGQVPPELCLKQIEAGDTRITAQQIHLDKDEVEDNGMIKIDILSNRGLAQLWDVSRQAIETYPTQDPLIAKLFAEGKNLGITYAESRALGKLFAALEVANIDDISLALALVRPGGHALPPKLDGTSYNKVANKGTKIQATSAITRASQADKFLAYDDDSIRYIAKLLKITESEAEVFRKAFAKGKWGEIQKFKALLKTQRPEWDDATREELIEQLQNLRQYSFCKSHALSYAKLVWALAYQKVHHPIPFWLATLNHCNSSYRKWVHYREAKAAGIHLRIGRPPWKLDSKGFLTGPKAVSKMVYYDKSDYFKHGYWVGDKFLPGMYLTVTESEKLTKGEMVQIKTASFRGIIACHRQYKTKKPGSNRMMTFVTLGYDDAKYLDLILWGGMKLGRVHCLEGQGIFHSEKGGDWVEVKQVKVSNI
jgi:DNA polymerase III alpha subunit